MRILLWITVGFAAACGLCAYGLESSLWLTFGIVAVVFAVVFLLIRKRLSKVLSVILLGTAFGFFWMCVYDVLYLSPLKPFDSITVTATVTVTDYSEKNYYGIGANGKISLGGKDYRIRLYVNDLEYLRPGDRITGKMELHLTTAGSAAESDYQQGLGVFLVGYLEDGSTYESTQRLEYRYYPAVLRMYIKELMEKLFPSDVHAFARALLLGDTSLLAYAEDTAYRLSGIRHVVAVSGLHISILFSLVYMAVGKRRVLTAILAIPVLVLFAAVAGFSPSVVRACTMQCLMIIAMLLRKDYDPPTALASSVLLMLLCNPMSVLSISLQLSVGCMAGIFLFARKIQQWLTAGKLGEITKGKTLKAKVVRWCVMSVAVTLSAMSLTTPLSAYYFGTVSLVGIVTNLLCLWLISYVFYGIMLSCAVGAVWIAGGRIIAAIVSAPILLVQKVSGYLSSFPLASVYTCSKYIVAWLIFVYILFALFLISRKKRPVVFALGIALGLLIAIGAAWIEPVAGNYLVTVIDVGQGQSVLLRCGSRNYLVDCGGENGEYAANKTADLLLSQGIIVLDGVIVTHFDADHVNGVEYLMQRLPVNNLYLPDVPDNTRFREELTQAYEDRITWIEKDSQLIRDDWRITILSSEIKKPGNESSLCVLFQRQNCDILITGDRSIRMEDAMMDRVKLPKLELLVVGHHGSASSTGFRLLSETQPAYVAISVGEDNRYEHPSQEALSRLERSGCVILRTDRDGDINFGR